MARFALEFDSLTIPSDPFPERDIQRAVEGAVTNENEVQKRLHSQGRKPDGTQQKVAVSKGHPSRLLETGELLDSRIVSQIRNGAELRYSGTRANGQSNAQVAASLHARGFENTFLDDKGQERVILDVIDGLEKNLKNLVLVKKGV